MSRLDIDQTAGRIDDIQMAIDDDSREIFAVEMDITTPANYSSEPVIKRRPINGTIYMLNRSGSGSNNFSLGSGRRQGNRGNYYLLTKDDISVIKYIEMEGVRFEIINIETIRGDYQRALLKSVEYGQKTRGYS